MQRAIDCWEGGLKATGGAIVPTKSFVYPISFRWDAQGRPHFQDPAEVDIPLTVLDEHEVRHTLAQIHPSVGKETLGVFLAPDGSHKQQLAALHAKVRSWCQHIRTGHLPALES